MHEYLVLYMCWNEGRGKLDELMTEISCCKSNEALNLLLCDVVMQQTAFAQLVCETLLEWGAKPDDIVRLPVDSGVQITTPACIAAAHASKQVRILLNRGSNPNQLHQHNQYMTPIYHAIKAQNLEAIHYLLDAGAKQMTMHHNKNATTFLLWAMQHSVSSAVIKILKNHDDPNQYIEP